MGRVGIFGGTFDPIHVGHLVAAVNARHTLDLDVVLMVVANDPWQKAGRPVTPASDRLALVSAAIGDVPGIEASSIEIDRGGRTFTVDTVTELKRRSPAADLYLIVGSDVAAELDSWERVEEVRAMVTLAVVTRPGVEASVPVGWNAQIVEIPRIDVSATELRARAAEGRPLDFLVPAAAIRCIRERGLYAG